MRTKTKVKGFGVVVFAVTLTLVLTSLQYSSVSEDDLKVGKKMPLSTYEMTGVDDQIHSLNSLKKANGLIVVFSCNTCPFVVGSNNFEGWEKQYNDLHKLAQNHDIGMVLVNSNVAKREGDDSMEAMKKHHKSNGYTMHYLVDKNAKLADALGAKTTPHIYMFDKDSKLVYKGSIDNSWDTKRETLKTYLIDAINAVGNGEKVEIQSSIPRGCSIKRIKK
jgi:thioredoxin-related protein